MQSLIGGYINIKQPFILTAKQNNKDTAAKLSHTNKRSNSHSPSNNQSDVSIFTNYYKYLLNSACKYETELYLSK